MKLAYFCALDQAADTKEKLGYTYYITYIFETIWSPESKAGALKLGYNLKPAYHDKWVQNEFECIYRNPKPTDSHSNKIGTHTLLDIPNSTYFSLLEHR